MSLGRDFTGEILQDTFKLERLIGRGGMGVVYEASHSRLARRFAVKLLYTEAASSPEAIARFRREAEITSSLGHQHIVEVIDFNHASDGTPYIVMELLEGEDLGTRIQRRGKIALPQAAEIIRQAASALQAAHQKGIVHRDLKPQNLFLCRREDREVFVKVVDFGVSKMIGAESKVLTQGRALLGTPYYMAPEQALERAAEVDARTDVYALGVILYEMLAGAPPFTADSIPTLLFKIVRDDVVPLRTLRPDLPPELSQVIGQALAKKPEDRFPSMRVLWRELAGPFGHNLPDLSVSGVGTLDAQTSAELSLADALGKTLPPGEGWEGGAAPTILEPKPAGRSTTISGELRAPPRARNPVRLLLAGLGAVALVGAGVVLASMFHSGAPPSIAARDQQLAGSTLDAPRPGANARPDAGVRPDRGGVAASTPDALPDARRPRIRQPAVSGAPGQINVQVLSEAGEVLFAQVSLDNGPPALAPLSFRDVKPGVHHLTASHPGFRRTTQRVILRPGATAKVIVRLTR